LADLLRLRLGPSDPAGEQVANGMHYRLYSHGVVVVNPDPTNDVQFPLAAVAKAYAPQGYFVDVFADVRFGDQLPGGGLLDLSPPGSGNVLIPHLAGRVYLYGSNTVYQP